jgi:UDP-glucuronate 4-epimerase
MAYTYAHLFGVPSTGLRFFTVYGPWGRPDMAYFSFTDAILKGLPIEVFNEGRLSRDFTYIDDVVEGLVRLLDAPPEGQENGREESEPPAALFNIGNHTPVSLDRFIAAIETATGRRARRIDRPMQPGDVKTTYADVAALSTRVGFAPTTSIEEGIGRFVAWYRDYRPSED